MKTRKCFWKGETHMLTDLLELLLDVSIWEADNPRISTRRHRIFQGILLLFLLVFLAVDGLLLYVGIVSSNGKLILCGIFLLACIAIIYRAVHKKKKNRRR